MNPLSEVVRMAKETGRFESLVDAIPYLRFLGVTMECVDGKLVGKMSYAEHLIGNAMIPALHGGTIGALLESTAIFETLFQVETNSLPKIVTLTVDYLRSGRPVDTYAAGVITKQGRRVVNVGVEAWQEDRSRPIARANAHFLVDPLEST